jgi:hypothetical protein
MEATTLPHRKTLRRICALGRFAGWGMIVLGFLNIGGFIYGPFTTGSGAQVRIALVSSMSRVTNNFLTALLVLGTVQLVHYAMEEDSEPGWLLRKGHIILSAFAVALLLAGLLHDWPILRGGPDVLHSRSYVRMVLDVTFMTLGSLLPTLAKALCVLGLGVLLRALLPILAEAKTLA